MRRSWCYPLFLANVYCLNFKFIGTGMFRLAAALITLVFICRDVMIGMDTLVMDFAATHVSVSSCYQLTWLGFFLRFPAVVNLPRCIELSHCVSAHYSLLTCLVWFLRELQQLSSPLFWSLFEVGSTVHQCAAWVSIPLLEWSSKKFGCSVINVSYLPYHLIQVFMFSVLVPPGVFDPLFPR